MRGDPAAGAHGLGMARRAGGGRGRRRARRYRTSSSTSTAHGPRRAGRAARRVFALPCVQEADSAISVPGARALVLPAGCEQGPPEAFLTGREFAHLHPEPDQSLHLALPTRDAQRAIDLGWAEWHLHALAGRWPRTIGMVFASRDLREVDAVELLVRRSCWFASGITMQPGTVPGGRSGDDDWR
jgi:hypothetical protein